MSAARPSSPPPLPRRRPGDRAPAPKSPDSPFGRWPVRDSDVLKMLPLDAITPNPRQPRRRFDRAELQTLAVSIAERGVLQPIVVRPSDQERFELIAGERRWRAAQQARLDKIPALVRDADDTTSLELALIENLARQDLTPVEEARSLRALIDDLAVTQRTLGAHLGRSRSDLTNTLRLLELPDDVLELIHAGTLSKGHGKALLSEPDPTRRCRLAQHAARDGWSIRRLDATIRRPGAGRPPATEAAAAVTTARRLAERLADRLPGASAAITPRGTGFTIRLQARDEEAAAALVRRLVGDD